MKLKNKQDAYLGTAEFQDEAAAPSGFGKSKKKKTILLVSVFAILLLLITAGVTLFLVDKHNKEMAAAAVEQERLYNQMVDDTLNNYTFYQGISIEGIDLSGKTMEEAQPLLKELEPSLRDEVAITVTYGDKSYTLTQDDFSYQYNTDQVLLKAYNIARTGDRMERYNKIVAMRDNTPVSFAIEVNRTDTESVVQGFVSKIDSECSVPAIPGKVVFKPLSDNRFSYAQGSGGKVINTEDLLSQINGILDADEHTGNVEAPSKIQEVTNDSGNIGELTQLISTYSTTSTNTANGTANMRRALEIINGTVLQPGEVFSFNGIVGDTTKERGFFPAGVIVNGKLDTGYGGGVCQASSTIYGAILRADLSIVARGPHSIRSTYVPIGQDAAIAYPSLDLKFKNNYDTPIYIEAWESGKKLTVNIYGKQSGTWDKIDIVSRQTSTIPQPADILTTDNSLAPGQKVQDEPGRAGSTATGEKVFYKNGAVVKTESIAKSSYPAKAAKYRVGPSAAANNPAESSSEASE